MLNHTTHMLLDGARMGALMGEAKTRNKAHDSLYRGGSEASLSAVAPYIFQFAYATPFGNWYLKTGWGDSWGILLKSSWPQSELHKHFRKFLKVETERGLSLYFRFYDPRVLRIFLPTCDTTQLREFFGDAIDYIIMEDEDPAFAMRYWHENGFLKSDRFAVADTIAALPDPQPLPQTAQDPLPPETIAALKEQGILEEVLQARGESIQEHAEPITPQPAAPAQVPVNPIRPPAEEAAPEPKPKTKWKMFD